MMKFVEKFRQLFSCGEYFCVCTYDSDDDGLGNGARCRRSMCIFGTNHKVIADASRQIRLCISGVLQSLCDRYPTIRVVATVHLNGVPQQTRLSNFRAPRPCYCHTVVGFLNNLRFAYEREWWQIKTIKKYVSYFRRNRCESGRRPICQWCDENDIFSDFFLLSAVFGFGN